MTPNPARLFVAAIVLFAAGSSWAQTLDENCVVNVLNRTVQVSPQGSWALPNVPVNMGRIRARATCTQGNQTISGQTDYFNVTRDSVTDVGAIVFQQQEPVPVSLAYTDTASITLTTVGATQQLAVRATYPDGTVRIVTTAADGTNYTSTNASIASVAADGLVTAHSSGVVLITARKDEVVAIRQIGVNVAGDKDHDGLPDDFERANGLDPNDPVDAQEDQDGDGLTALQEFQLGTNLRVADSDGDGLNDGEEVVAGTDGFVTNPLNADTDGDGLRDGLEVLAGSSPTDPNDRNLEGALDRLEVSPPNVTLVFNAISTEVSSQLAVTGVLIDGSTIDLTSKSTGTSYASSDLSIVSFGATDGEIFGGASGTASVTVANSGKQFVVAVLVESFQPVALSSIAIPGYANNVEVAGDYAFIAAGAAGLQVVDVSDRVHPAVVAGLDTDGVAIDVRVVGRFAYVADGNSGLKIIDVNDPLQPQLVGALDTPGLAQDLKVQGGFAYIADGAAGVTIAEVSDPTAPVLRGQLSGIGTARGIDVEGDRAVVVADTSLFVLDTTILAAPLAVGTVNIGPVKDVVMSGNYAYVAASNSGYRVVRLTVPTAPVVVGGDGAIVPRDVELMDGFAFFAEQLFPNVIAFMNVGDPESPVFQGTIDLRPFGDYAGTGISLDGSHAYVTEEVTVVGSDFGTTGNTRLFIAQYRRIGDTGGVAPTVTITRPTTTQSVVGGQPATVAVEATDDVGVRRVRVAVEGVEQAVDTTRPFETIINVPFGVTSISIVATAEDFGGNQSSAQRTLAVRPDTDHDGLADDDELLTHHTNPNDADTDDDGLDDGFEVRLGTDPLSSDSDGDGRSDAEEVNAGTDPLNPDVVAPTVIAVDPPDHATNTPENRPVTATFSEPLRAQSITNDTLRVLQSGTPVAGTVRLMPNGVDVVFTPTGLLNDFTQYDVVVAGARDRAGNPLATPFQWQFTTGNIVDVTPPQIAASNPVAGAADVPTNTIVTVLMNESIDPLSVSTTSVRVQDLVGAVLGSVPGAVSLGEDGRTLTFVPNAALAVRRQHTFSLNGVKDLFGNATNFASFNFTTAFTADAAAPQIVSMNPPEGAASVPINAKPAVRFNEAINRLSVGEIELRQGTTVVPTQRQFAADSSGSVVTLVPTQPLAASTTYTFAVAGVQDLSGNVLAAGRTLTFTTGGAADLANPTLVLRTPLASATGVPRNTQIEAQFNEQLNPVTISRTSIQLLRSTGSVVVPGTVTLSPDGTAVRFVPSAALEGGTQYQFMVGIAAAIQDVAGNTFASSWIFTTSTATDTTAPVVQLQSLADGATAVPVNGRIVLRFDAPLADRCVNTQTVRVTSGGTPVAGNVTLSTDRRTLTFTPQAALNANTAYTLTLQGVCDLAGNTLDGYTVGFTTGATPDTTKPTVQITPAQGASNVPVTTPIVMLFSEQIDVTSLASSIQVTASGISGEIAGTLAVSGNEVRFTSLDPLPGNRSIAVFVSGTSDLAGNTLNAVGRSFTTGAAGDATAPHIISMVPNDGTVDVAPISQVVLTFNESLNPATVSAGSVALFANGDIVPATLSLSQDSRTLVITSLLANANLPVGSIVSVIVSSDVRDLSGNALPDFIGAFTTTAALDVDRPTVVTQFPGNGASGVLPDATVVLYTSERLTAASVQGAVHVSQNGVLLPGTVTTSGDGQVVRYRPNQPFARDALIQVFIDSNAVDLNGNALLNFQGSFRTAADPAVAPPTVVAFAPNFPGATLTGGVPVNAALDILMSEPIDATTLGAGVIVRDAPPPTGAIVATDATLVGGGRIIRLRPQTLNPGQFYFVQVLNALKDAGGQNLVAGQQFSFQVANVPQPDTVAPRVIALSPANGATGIGINAQVHARFDEPISPLTVGVALEQTAIGSVFWSDNNREVRFVRHAPYEPNTQVTESVAGAQDFGGNAVDGTLTSTTFTTGAAADTAASNQFELITAGSAVPVNAALRLRFAEALDPVSVNTGTIQVKDTTLNANVPIAVTLEPDGSTVTVVPANPWALGRDFDVRAIGVRDLAGNQTGAFLSRGFTSALTPDVTPPAVSVFSIPDSATGIPTNATVQVRFTESIDAMTLGGTVLSRDGAPQPATLLLSGDRRTVTFKLIQPLLGNAIHALTVSGVRDLAGNVAADRALTFTTAASLDTVVPTFVSRTPTLNATGVPRNTQIALQMNDRVNAVIATTADVMTLTPVGSSQPVAGTVSLSPDARTIQFVPAQPLAANQQYSFRAQDAEDLGGNHFTIAWSFTTGAAADATPPQVTLQSIADGATAVPVNGRVVLQFDSALAERCVNGQTVQLSSGGITVAGTLTLNVDRTRLTFAPQTPLATNTAYTLRLQGVCDLAGNVVANFTVGFTTSGNASPDTTPPTVQFTPTNGSNNVPVTTAVTFTFNEPLDVTTLAGGLRVGITSPATEIAGTLSVNNNVVTFTPLGPLPGNKGISVQVNGVTDLAGNTTGAAALFTTGAAGDVTAPQLLSVSPTDQSVDVPPGAPIVLIFSETLDPTVTNANLRLFVNGNIVVPTISSSVDTRAFILSANLPLGSVVSVIATGDLRDLSGNRFTDFVSAFTTASSGDAARPTIASQVPGNGTTGVRRGSNIVLYASEPLAPDTVGPALHVAHNGVPIDGTLTFAANAQVVTFHPNQPWANNALVDVFLDDSATDLAGNALQSHHAAFQVVPNLTGVRPIVTGFAPSAVVGGIPINSVLDVLFNKPLDPASVSSTTVTLRENVTGQLVPSTVSLTQDGFVIRVQPQAALVPSRTHTVQLTTGVRDTTGLTMQFAQSQPFATSAVGVADTQPPAVASMSPPTASVGLGINAQVHARFDEPMNLFSLLPSPQSPVSLFWTANNRDLRIVRHEPYGANAEITESVAGAQDYAGNAVAAPFSTTFTTGDVADVKLPSVLDSTPFNAATNVGGNALLRVLFDDVLDPASVNSTSVFLTENLAPLAGTPTLEPDGRTVTLVQTQALQAGRSYTFVRQGVRDLAGNASTSNNASFSVGPATDTLGPTVTATGVQDGQTGVFTNAPLTVQFDEAVSSFRLSGVTLRRGGQNVPATLNVSGDHRTLTFKTVQPLAANTTYVLSVTGVEDLSGNALTASRTITFTTGPGADF